MQERLIMLSGLYIQTQESWENFFFETVNAFSVRVNPQIQKQYQYFNVGRSKFQTRYYNINSKKMRIQKG